jgi:hypothetical protein
VAERVDRKDDLDGLCVVLGSDRTLIDRQDGENTAGPPPAPGLGGDVAVAEPGPGESTGDRDVHNLEQ